MEMSIAPQHKALSLDFKPAKSTVRTKILLKGTEQDPEFLKHVFYNVHELILKVTKKAKYNPS